MVERIRALLESRQLTPTQFADVIGVARPIVSHILSGRNKPSLEVVQRILAAMPDLAMPWLLNGTGPMLAGPSVAPVPPVPLEGASPAVPQTTPVPATVAADGRARTVAGTAIDNHKIPSPASKPTDKEILSDNVPPLRAYSSTPSRSRPVPKRFVANAAPAEQPAQAPAGMQVPPQAVATEVPPMAALTQDTNPGPHMPMPTAPAEAAATAPLHPAPADDTQGAALASALFAGGDKPIRRIVIFYRDGSFADYQPE